MSRRLVPCALVALAALALIPAPAAAAARDAARLARADALLAERAGWDEAIAIYRELVAADETWSLPRQQLARVLAWRGDYDESLRAYAALLADPDPPAGAAVERAEVLSWAGRNAEARAAFEALLAREAGDARAARGLARVHRWSGERALADRWYARALAAEDDAEAREEQAALRAELQRRSSATARFFRDSDDFTLWRSSAEIGFDLDFDTALRFTTGVLWASGEGEDGSVLADLGQEDRAQDARVAVERRFGPRWKGVLEAGGRHWSRSRARPLARAALELTPDEGTAFGFEVRHDDLIERSLSLASALRGIGDTTARASWWRQLTPAWEGYAAAEGSLFTDGNGQAGFGASAAWRPWPERQVLLGLSADVQHYRRDSPYYYSPDFDCGATLGLSGSLPIRGALALTFDLGGGAGLASEQDDTSFGPAYRVKAGLAWRRGGFRVALDAERSQSQREVAYTTHGAQLQLGWVF